MDTLSVTHISQHPSADKMHTPDRVLVLRPIDGKPYTTGGLLDPRIFKGENKLHAMMDLQTSLWYLKYDMGVIPQPLQQRFTSLRRCLEYTRAYFLSRNIEIIEVIDYRAE